MKCFSITCLIGILVVLAQNTAKGQAMHFSQYYNTPLLLNPANTALLSDNDYRISANHRTQWAAYPAPYYTSSLATDFQVLPNQSRTNWLGLGLALYHDNVGDGKLSLFRTEGFIAYHLSLGEYQMLSFGASGSYNSRSVNFSKFSYPVQWDGATFNRRNDNLENKGLEKANYLAANAGINYALFPHEDLYMKLGVGMANLNRPTETFFGGNSNTIGFRYFANADVLYKANPTFILNPSAYFSMQGSAKEIVFGSTMMFNLVTPDDQIANNQLFFGAYHRFNDAIIGLVGIQYVGVRFTLSYDYTVSSLPVNAGKGTGAIELSIKYEGIYVAGSRANRKFHCPRF